MENTYKIAFLGSSLLSAYWNGAATYYRGIIKELYKLGHQVTFFEPDIYDRQQHRDLPEVNWATSVVYDAHLNEVEKLVSNLNDFDIIIKTSGIGAFDNFFEQKLPDYKQEHQLLIFWDVDAPATLDRMRQNLKDAFRENLQKFDLILTYGGGQAVIDTYLSFGAKACIPVYNALDPETHFPTLKNTAFECDLAFLGNRLPDRETRVEDFFITAAQHLPQKQFLLGGSGWENKELPQNIKLAGHVYTKDHNALNSTALAVLNISRDSMAAYGFSPATRVFEAAGAGACIITDDWLGIDYFFEPDIEILVAKNGQEVAAILANLTPERAKLIGSAALKRVLRDHTYALRAEEVQAIFQQYITHKN